MRLNLNLLLLALSFVIVALGSPSLSGICSMVAGAVGYAFFWQGALHWSPKTRFWLASGWFTAVQAIQLSWLCSTHYMGPSIIVVYALLVLILGLQFGLLTWLARLPLTWLQIFGLSGFWVVMEWSRLFIFSGFTWNPCGLALAANSLSIQFSSLIGIYGLCFWVIFTNLAALKNRQIWICLAAIPYLFGICHQYYWRAEKGEGKQLSIALVQTAIRPEQRDRVHGDNGVHIHPIQQWRRILTLLKEKGLSHCDLIVLPEGALPGGARRLIYPLQAAQKVWLEFGLSSEMPPLIEPYVHGAYATNSFWTQCVANHFGAEVVLGLDDDERESVYNAAFHFHPSGKTSRYEKQILIPIGEYIPFPSLSTLFLDQFGISSSFTSGTSAKIFQGIVPMGIFICLEETYSQLVRENRKAGAELFVNITNDVWFPETRLPWHHLDHGRLRAAENGVYLLRSCNTGVTAVVDCFGRAQKTLPVSETASGVLSTTIQIQSIPTLYTLLGDVPILLLSGGLAFIYASWHIFRTFFSSKRIKQTQC